MFIVSYYQGKALEWMQPYILEFLNKKWLIKLSTNTVNLLKPANYITQLQTILEEINLK